MEKTFRLGDSLITIQSKGDNIEEIPTILTNLAKKIKDQIKTVQAITDKTVFIYDNLYNTIKECKPAKLGGLDEYRIMDIRIKGDDLLEGLKSHKRLYVGNESIFDGLHRHIIIAETKEDLVKALKSEIDNL